MNRREFVVRSATGLGATMLSSLLEPSAALAACSLKTTRWLRAGERGYMKYDREGLIVQLNGDGADTAQREGMYWFARGFYRSSAEFPVKPPVPSRDATYKSVIPRFLVRNAAGKLIGFRRHPTQPGNNSDPAKVSRDQVLPLIAAMSVWDDWGTLKEVHDFLADQPGPLSWLNKDWMDLYRQFVRRARNEAVDETIDKTLLDAAVEARLCCIRDANDVGDDLNLAVLLMLSEVPRQKKDYIAAIRKKFAEHRPMNYGIYLGEYYKRYTRLASLPADVMIDRIEKGIAAGWQPNCSSTLGAFRWYFRSEAGANAGMARMYRPLINCYLGAATPPPGTRFQAYNCGALSPLVKSLCQRN